VFHSLTSTFAFALLTDRIFLSDCPPLVGRPPAAHQ
jgi:hypothetical protein